MQGNEQRKTNTQKAQQPEEQAKEDKSESHFLKIPDSGGSLLSRRKNMDRIRQSFKLSLTPSKITDIRNYVLTPMYARGDKIPQMFNIQGQDELQNFQDPKSFKQKYQILEKLGQGAHGVVKKCRHKQSQKNYAVKTLALDQQQTIFLRRNFLAVKCLNHPNILHYKALHFDRKKNKCYLVMEYATGKQLKSFVGKMKSQQTLKRIFKQLFSAIQYMHDMNICHRDIKPDNILYDQQKQEIKIVDFGISRKTIVKNQKRYMLTVTGTFDYRAPQIMEGGGYDESVDIWAAGISLYQMILGRTPFQSEYKIDIINNICNKEVEFNQQVWEDYSKFLRDLITRLLRKKKQQRLTAAQALNHLWFINDQNAQKDEKYQSMKIQSKTRAPATNANITSVVKKNLYKQSTCKPCISLVQSDEDCGLIEDN